MHSVKIFAAGAAALAAASLPAQAQSAYPQKPIRLIVAFTPGGSLDHTARLIAQKLVDVYGQPVVVDNRPGAGGLTGSDLVAKAPPDGYTLLMASGSNAVNVALYPSAPHHFGRDFAPVTQAVSNAYAMVAHPALAANSVKELIALARAKPRQINFGSSGTGGLPHLAGELMQTMAGIEMTHVPYKGAVPAVIDMIAGRVDLMINALPLLLPHVKSGKLKMLAVTTPRRAQAVPDVPTIAESGVPGYDVNGWYGVVAPARTPAPVLVSLNQEIVRILAAPEVRERFKADGSDPVGSSREQFAAVIRADIDKWTRFARASNIRLE